MAEHQHARRPPPLPQRFRVRELVQPLSVQRIQAADGEQHQRDQERPEVDRLPHPSGVHRRRRAALGTPSSNSSWLPQSAIECTVSVALSQKKAATPLAQAMAVMPSANTIARPESPLLTWSGVVAGRGSSNRRRAAGPVSRQASFNVAWQDVRMAARNRPALASRSSSWATAAVLVRPIRPEDAEPLSAAFPLLQPEEVASGCTPCQVPPAMAAERLTWRTRNPIRAGRREPLPPGRGRWSAVARRRRSTPAPATRSS